jgi:hypothetical protein
MRPNARCGGAGCTQGVRLTVRRVVEQKQDDIFAGLFGWFGAICEPSRDVGPTTFSETPRAANQAWFDQMGASDSDIRRIFMRFGTYFHRAID